MTALPPAPRSSFAESLAGADSAADAQRLRGLRRMKVVALSFLVGATVVFFVCTWAQSNGAAAWVGYVRAAAEAGMVGALADWFAVTALFKHPLGIPIPHTAIIKRKKAQLGDGLGAFIRENFMSPQVVEATVIAQTGDHIEATMRVRQRHVITVVMDADYDVTFGRLDAQHGYSISRSTRISEIGSAGGKTEHVLNAGEEHGFLWRLNTYWSYEERDGGLYIQMETVSLTRSIPTGLGWAVGPFVESVPKGSVEFTLRAVCNALRKPQELGPSDANNKRN